MDDLQALVEKWRADIKERGGSGCGCYGKNQQQRQDADELAALLAKRAPSWQPIATTGGICPVCKHEPDSVEDGPDER